MLADNTASILTAQFLDDALLIIVSVVFVLVTVGAVFTAIPVIAGAESIRIGLFEDVLPAEDVILVPCVPGALVRRGKTGEVRLGDYSLHEINMPEIFPVTFV